MSCISNTLDIFVCTININLYYTKQSLSGFNLTCAWLYISKKLSGFNLTCVWLYITKKFIRFHGIQYWNLLPIELQYIASSHKRKLIIS